MTHLTAVEIPLCCTENRKCKLVLFNARKDRKLYIFLKKKVIQLEREDVNNLNNPNFGQKQLIFYGICKFLGIPLTPLDEQCKCKEFLGCGGGRVA